MILNNTTRFRLFLKQLLSISINIALALIFQLMGFNTLFNKDYQYQ